MFPLFFLKMMLLLFYFVSAFSFCEASEYKFSLTRTTDWQFVGRRVKYTLTMIIPESTELTTKIKLPVNGSAILRLTEAKITEVSEQLTVDNNATNMTSSGNDGLNDIAFFNFGTVTRASSENDTKIKIEFEVQVMNHEDIVNGGLQWVSVGTQYGANQSVWAAMLAVKTVHTACKRPVLNVDLSGVPTTGHAVLFGDQITLRLAVSHSSLTTDIVDSGTIQLPLPSFLTYHSHTTLDDSASVVVSNVASTVYIKFGTLEFAQTVGVKIKLNLDAGKTRADGKIHDGTVHVNLKYNGSTDTCSSSSGSREFGHEGPASTSFKYYVKKAACDEPLGMEDGSIPDGAITASSYSPGREPHTARLKNQGAWVPNGPLAKEKSQFLQVNFTSKVKVNRLSLQGYDDCFVNSLSLFFSDDGVIWKPYKEGSKIKEFSASMRMIVLLIPIKAVYIRINPTSWLNCIALRVEFYGCVLGQLPKSPDALIFTSRGYLLDEANNVMYVCSVPMKSKKGVPKCYLSSDDGQSWTGMDNRLWVILGHDTTTKTLFGVSGNGKAIMKSTEDHTARFKAVPQNDWFKVKDKATTTHAMWLDSSMAITNTSSAPQTEHTVTSTSGTKWGASANGIHVLQGSSEWKLKAIWMCYDFGYIDVHICSGGFDDPSKGYCIGNAASIKVDSVEKIMNLGRGYNVVVLNRGGSFIDSVSFDTFASPTADDKLGAYIDSLQENVIVLIAVADEATYGANAGEEDKMGANLQLLSLGAKNPRPPGYRASWALVGYKGPRADVDWIRQEQAPAFEGPTEISVQIPKITGVCM